MWTNLAIKKIKSIDMKKLSLFFVAIMVLHFGNISGQTVYITKTGEKYHEHGCRYLKKSSISLDLSDAIKRGYNPCGICKPPATSTSTTNKHYTPEDKSSKTSSDETLSQQCGAKTKAGSRCKRMTKSSNGFCWQHGGS